MNVLSVITARFEYLTSATVSGSSFDPVETIEVVSSNVGGSGNDV